jgi:ABC-type sulfate/molybdate transport systems ATPase subunit
LLDEPLNALDRASVQTVREQLARCAADRRQAWVVVSHEGLGAAEAAAVVLDLPEPAPWA